MSVCVYMGVHTHTGSWSESAFPAPHTDRFDGQFVPLCGRCIIPYRGCRLHGSLGALTLHSFIHSFVLPKPKDAPE